MTRSGLGFKRHVAEQRFDLALNRRELNRFGWAVEINPYSPSWPPVKRTALGRIEHEGATVTQSQGRAVVYSGDDLFKFVSDAPWQALVAMGQSPLHRDVAAPGPRASAAMRVRRQTSAYGHIVRFREPDGDHTRLTFEWDVFLLAGDPAYDPLVPAGQSVFGSPDGIWVDPDGRVWIETDISSSSQNLASKGLERPQRRTPHREPDRGKVGT